MERQFAMIECQLIPYDARYYSIIRSNLHAAADQTAVRMVLRNEGSFKQPPDILFLVHETPEAILSPEQATHYAKFTAIIMLSRAPLSSFERNRYTFPIHSMLTIRCPQALFTRAMLRAMTRKNLEFSADCQAAYRNLEESLQTISSLKKVGEIIG
ncbi:MAG: hypothetical protein AB8B94_07880 [Hyphomicrobiales bacterium]